MRSLTDISPLATPRRGFLDAILLYITCACQEVDEADVGGERRLREVDDAFTVRYLAPPDQQWSFFQARSLCCTPHACTG